MSSPYPPANSNGWQQQQQPQQHTWQQQPPQQGYAPQYNSQYPPQQQMNYGGNYGAGQNNGYYQQQPPQGSEAPAGAQSMAKPAPYGNPYEGPSMYGDDYKMMQGKFEDVKPKWNDLIFLVLFIAHLGGFIAISVIALRALGSDSLGDFGGSSIAPTAQTAYLLAIIAVTGLVLSVLMLLLVRAFTKIILEITLFLSVAMSVGYAIYLWVIGYWSGAIIFTVIAVISIIAYFPMRKRIPFSRELLRFVLRIAKEYPSTYVIAFLGALLQAAWSVYWSFTAVAIYQKWSPNAQGSSTSGGSASSATVTGLLVYAVFSLYWTSQVITNVTLTIEAGIFGTFYFTGGRKPANGAPPARRVTWGAFKRATTYSLGSIAFGSLIVALLDLLRAIFSAMRQQAASSGDAFTAIMACCAECCIGCIAWAVEYFNRYAYITIALYGKKYIEAAKDTWRLFKDRGIDVLINDCLINNIWTFGSFVVGALCSLFAFLYLTIADPSYIDNNSSLRAALMGFAFILGFFIAHTLGYGCLSAGASTIMTALAYDPSALAELDPQLYSIIAQTYPKVTSAV